MSELTECDYCNNAYHEDKFIGDRCPVCHDIYSEQKVAGVVKAFLRRANIPIPEDIRSYTAHMMTALTVMDHKDDNCWCSPTCEILADGSKLFIHNQIH